MNNMDLVAIGAKLGLYFVPFLFALCFHEYAHGVVAHWLGDDTAKHAGRLSMNPLSHSDLLGTWILPIAAILFGLPFFGWGKPVPVNERNLRSRKWGMFYVAFAGPLSNVFLALVGTVLLAFAMVYATRTGGGEMYITFLTVFLQINMFLAIFNMIPIHPLDGGKVVAPFLPYEWNRWLEENEGILGIALIMFIFTAGRVLAVPVGIAVSHLYSLSQTLASAIG
jgi:Zn-dependent protease